MLPAVAAAWLRILLTLVSNSCSFVRPDLLSNIPNLISSIKVLTSSFLFVIALTISIFVFLSAIRSLIPTLNDAVFKYSVIMFCQSSIKFEDAVFPKSLQIL